MRVLYRAQNANNTGYTTEAIFFKETTIIGTIAHPVSHVLYIYILTYVVDLDLHPRSIKPLNHLELVVADIISTMLATVTTYTGHVCLTIASRMAKTLLNYSMAPIGTSVSSIRV